MSGAWCRLMYSCEIFKKNCPVAPPFHTISPPLALPATSTMQQLRCTGAFLDWSGPPDVSWTTQVAPRAMGVERRVALCVPGRLPEPRQLARSPQARAELHGRVVAQLPSFGGR